MNKCNRTIEFANGLHYSYHKCYKKFFKQVEYKSPQNSEIINECLCKTHYNALIKNINRIALKTKFQFELKIL